MVSSMAPLHSPGQDCQNEMQHDFLGNMTQLALALALVSDDANGIINGSITSPSSRQSK